MSEEIEQEVLDKAAEMGWVPKEEWKGNPDVWRPADEYVARGEQILPIVKKRLTEEIEAVKRELNTAIKMRDKEFEKIKEESYKKAKDEYDKKLQELSAKEFEAAQGNDFDEWQKIQGEKQKLKPPEEPKVQNETPVFTEWKKANDWYETDEDLTDLAYAKAGKLTQKMDKGEMDRLPEDEFYKEVERQVKAAMPHKFTNPNREKASVTEGSGHETPTGGKNSWNNVPASAKATFKRQAAEWERRGKKLDRDEWVKTYFEG